MGMREEESLAKFEYLGGCLDAMEGILVDEGTHERRVKDCPAAKNGGVRGFNIVVS